MTVRALAWMWQIHEPTPLKWAFVALAVLNIALMLWLSFRSFPSWFSVYLVGAGVASLLQVSPLWGWWGELSLILLGTLWVASIIPSDGWERLFLGGVALMVLSAILLAMPGPWPHWSASLYFARIYSSVVFFAATAACAADPWVRGKPTDWRTVVAAVWFLTVVLAGGNWNAAYWNVAIAAKLAWFGCLIAWISLPGDRAKHAVRYPQSSDPLRHAP